MVIYNMRITQLFPKINFKNLDILYIDKIKKDLINNILVSNKKEEIRTYNEILYFLSYIEDIKIKADNKEKIDYP